MESDDPTWSWSDDRTLILAITPKRSGEFPIHVRGWLCQDGYTDCTRNPSSGIARDQQGWVVDQASVTVARVETTPSPAVYISDDFVGNLDSGWKLLGTARHNPAGFIVLTEDRNDQTGVLIRKSPLLTERFSVDFSFEIGGGDCCDADGLALFIARSAPESLKRHDVHHGHTFGSRDLDGIAVEFDTWQDWSFEQSGNHVGLTLLGEAEPVRLVEKELDVELNNSGVFDATIIFDSGRVQVFLENATMSMGTTLVLDSTVATTHIPPEGHIGFVGVTGSWSDRHVIHSVHVQALD